MIMDAAGMGKTHLRGNTTHLASVDAENGADIVFIAFILTDP